MSTYLKAWIAKGFSIRNNIFNITITKDHFANTILKCIFMKKNYEPVNILLDLAHNVRLTINQY